MNALERKLESQSETISRLRARASAAGATPTAALLSVAGGAALGGFVDEASRARGGGPISRFVGGAAIVGGYAMKSPVLMGLGVGMILDVARSAGATVAGQVMPPSAAPAAATPAP